MRQSSTTLLRCRLTGLLPAITFALFVPAGCIPATRDVPKEFFDKGVAEIKAGKSNSIHLYDTCNTDSLLHSISGLTGVEKIVFEPTDVTAAGLADVATFPDLRAIDFYHARITDGWLNALTASETLEDISIEMDSFKHPVFSVRNLFALPHLRKLSLSAYIFEVNGDVDEGLEWTDFALIELKQATALAELELSGEFEKRRADLIALQKALPHCKISVVNRSNHQHVRMPVAELPTP